MASTAQQQSSPVRIVGIGLVILLHIGLVYALVSGLAFRAVEVAPVTIEATIVPEARPETVERPAPPPPEFQPPPAPVVPVPEVTIAPKPPPASHTAITTLPPVRPPEPVPAPAPAPAPPPREPVTVGPHIDIAGSLEPAYPPASRRLGEQGTVILEVTVEPDGRASNVRIVTSSGFPRLDEAAIAGVRENYRFAPGTRDGKPAPMPYTFNFTWKLR